MAHQLTITAKTGPDKPVTAGVIPNVQRIDFNLAGKLVQIYADGVNVKEFDINPSTTTTFTITAGQYAMVIS